MVNMLPSHDNDLVIVPSCDDSMLIDGNTRGPNQIASILSVLVAVVAKHTLTTQSPSCRRMLAVSYAVKPCTGEQLFVASECVLKHV